MLHNIYKSIFVVFAVTILAIGCGKKQKPEDSMPVDSGTDTNITTQPMDLSKTAGSDSGTIPGLSSIHFEYDQSNLTAEAKKILADNADWMKKNGNVTMQVEGHCDERGSIEYNLALGERRAKAVKAYIVSLGIDSKKLTVISYGKEKKLADGDSEEVHYKNRRANFVPMSN